VKTRHSIDRIFESSGLTEEELVKRSGLTRQRVEAILTGRWLPAPRERKAMAAALAVDESDVDWGHTISPRNVRYHRFGLPHEPGA